MFRLSVLRYYFVRGSGFANRRLHTNFPASFKRRTSKKRQTNGKNSRHRSRHDQFVHGYHGRRRTRGPRKLGRRAHDPLSRRLHQVRRTARRPGRQTAGDHQFAKHHFLGQALHGPEVRRSARGRASRALQGREGRERRRAHSGTGRRRDKDFLPTGNQRDDPREAEVRCGSQARREDHASCHYGARLLQ